MLVLARKQLESIVIVNTETGDRMTVTVARISERQVRLSFDAPDHIKIHRTEIGEFADQTQTPADISG